MFSVSVRVFPSGDERCVGRVRNIICDSQQQVRLCAILNGKYSSIIEKFGVVGEERCMIATASVPALRLTQHTPLNKLARCCSVYMEKWIMVVVRSVLVFNNSSSSRVCFLPPFGGGECCMIVYIGATNGAFCCRIICVCCTYT